MTLENRSIDVSSRWQRVPGIAGYFDKIEQKVVQGKQYTYSPTDISAVIKQYGKRQRNGKVLKFLKQKATRSAFATDLTFDDEEPPDIDDTIATSFTSTREPKPTDINTKNKIKNKRRENNRERHNNNNITKENQSQLRVESQRDRSSLPVLKTRTHRRKVNRAEKKKKKQVREPCSACGGTTHSFTRCDLVQEQDKDWILKQNRETFRSNMKMAIF